MSDNLLSIIAKKRHSLEKQGLPKTLLITSTRPGVGSVGELFLGKLCKSFAPNELLCTAGVSIYDVPVLDADLKWLAIDTFQLPPEYPKQCAEERGLAKLKRRLQHFEILQKDLKDQISKIIAAINEQNIELLWFVLNSPSMVIIADAVLSQTDKPAMAIVWDPIGSTAEQHGMDRRSKLKLEKIFDRVLLKMKSCGVASFGMKEYFAARTNLPTRVLINIPNPSTKSSEHLPTDKLIVSFAGSLYAVNEFEALLESINRCEWKIANRTVELQIFSRHFDVPRGIISKTMNLSLKGHVSEDTLVEELASSHVAYLPYWFDKKYEKAVKICFPNKLAAYLAAGCPILFHGPQNSSPAQFLSRYRVGICVSSLAHTDLINALKYLISDKEFLANYSAERKRALSEEINPESFEAGFLDLIETAVPAYRDSTVF